MTIQQGRDAYDKAHRRGTASNDVETLRRASRLARGAAMFRATKGDREARDALAAIAAEQVTESAEPQEDQPRAPRPDPTQGVRGTSVRTSGIDVGREMFEARRTPPPDVA